MPGKRVAASETMPALADEARRPDDLLGRHVADGPDLLAETLMRVTSSLPRPSRPLRASARQTRSGVSGRSRIDDAGGLA